MITPLCPYNLNAVNEFRRQNIDELTRQLGQKTDLNPLNQAHAKFNIQLVSQLIRYRENALPSIKNIIEKSKDEKQICEALFTLDRMIENNVKGIKNLYPTLSKLNNTNSPNIQVYLAGIYRKTLIPDAFGPLCKMLIRNSIQPQIETSEFDATEEIGGAILDYLRAKGAVHFYSQNEIK